MFQLHLHSRLNTWLQYIAQRQLRDEMENIYAFIWCILSKRFDGTWYVSSNHTEIITIVTHFGHTGSVTSLTSIKLWPQYVSLKLCQLINHYTSKCICMQYLKLSRLHHNQWFHSSMGSAIQGDVTLNNGQYHNPCERGGGGNQCRLLHSPRALS